MCTHSKHFKPNNVKRAWLIMLFLWLLSPLRAQEVDVVVDKTVTLSEWNVAAFINTSGGGAGFQYGWTPDNYNKHFWEIDFLYSFHPKQVRVKNPYYPGSKTFCYGKLYDLYFLRGGYGYQRTIHHKPYWGGVRIRYTLSGGFSLGMGLPMYVVAMTGDLGGMVERYDPDKHNVDNIIGRGPYFKGIGKTALRPGFYAKTGLNFDFSQKDLVINALEIGLTVDIIIPPLQQMAFNKAKPFYLCAYIAYNIGKRRGVH
jgi:hypothetical protein